MKKQKEKDAADAAALQKQQNADLLKAQEQYQKEQQTALNAYQQQQAQAQKEYEAEQQRIFEEQRKAAEAEAKRQEERLRKLNTLGPQSINVSDVRTTEGANLIIDLMQNAQDPQLIQARLQTKAIQQLNANLISFVDSYFNNAVQLI